MTRLAASTQRELMVQTRYGLWPVAAALTVLMTAVILLAGQPAATILGPLILVIDTATIGVLFAAVLVLFERSEGAFDGLRVAPVRPGEYVLTKVGSLALMSTASAIPITLAAVRGTGSGLGGVLLTVGGVALLSTLMLTVGVAMVLPHRSLIDFVTRGIWPLVPLLLAPVPHVIGLWTHPLLYVIPSTGAADLMRAGIDPGMSLGPGRLTAIIGYLAVAIAAAAWMAVRNWDADERTAPPRSADNASGAASMQIPARVGRPPLLGAAAPLARLDLQSIRRDPMLGTILVAPVLLALAVRFGYPAFEQFAAGSWGLNLSPHQPLLAVAVVVLHVPYMLGSLTAMLMSEDLDECHLLALRVTPLSLTGYMAYRLGVAGLLSFTGLVVAVAVVGPNWFSWSWPLLLALLLAAATGPLAALLVTSTASNRVEALSMLKIVNLVPVAVPIAAWFVDVPWRWALAPFPHLWVSDATWASSAPSAEFWIAMAGGTVMMVAIGLWLSHLAFQRLAGW